MLHCRYGDNSIRKVGTNASSIHSGQRFGGLGAIPCGNGFGLLHRKTFRDSSTTIHRRYGNAASANHASTGISIHRRTSTLQHHDTHRETVHRYAGDGVWRTQAPVEPFAVAWIAGNYTSRSRPMRSRDQTIKVTSTSTHCGNGTLASARRRAATQRLNRPTRGGRRWVISTSRFAEQPHPVPSGGNIALRATGHVSGDAPPSAHNSPHAPRTRRQLLHRDPA